MGEESQRARLQPCKAGDDRLMALSYLEVAAIKDAKSYKALGFSAQKIYDHLKFTFSEQEIRTAFREAGLDYEGVEG